MKKTYKQKLQEEQSVDILKRVAKRVEETTIDISDMKSDLKMVNLRLSGVEHNTEMMKVDMEKMRGDIVDLRGGLKEVRGEIEGVRGELATMKKGIKEIKRDTEGLIVTTTHILKKGVTLDEHNTLSQRVSALEQS